MLGLVDRASVYTENPGPGGVYDVLVKTNLHCRLEHVGGGQSVSDRAAMREIRHLVFEISYNMPEDCEILIDGQRWNPIPGTFARMRGVNNRRIIRAVDVASVRGTSV